MRDYDVHIGVIGSAVGTKGYVRIRYFTENSKDIENFDRIFDSEGNVYKIKMISEKKDNSILASIEGVNSRKEAERLNNRVLMIRRSSLGELSEGEYYHIDLLGSKVYEVDGTFLGVVKSVYNHGASDIMEIFNNINGHYISYPITKEFIVEMRLDKKEITVHKMEEFEGI